MKGNKAVSESADSSAWRAHRSWRNRTTTHRRSGGLAAFVAASAIGLAACSGSSTPNAASPPTVASLGTSNGHSGGSTTTTLPRGNATALVDEWAACERSHGDPNQADPIIDSHGGINITIPQGSNLAGEALHDVTGTCSEYLAAAQKVLRAEIAYAPFDPNEAVLVQYVNCMRANGVSNYPYPQGDKTDFNGTGINLNSPFVMNAGKVCGKQINAPVWWINGWGPPGDISSSSGPTNGPAHSGPVPVNG